MSVGGSGSGAAVLSTTGIAVVGASLEKISDGGEEAGGSTPSEAGVAGASPPPALRLSGLNMSGTAS
jgi:hypothetical protein